MYSWLRATIHTVRRPVGRRPPTELTCCPSSGRRRPYSSSSAASTATATATATASSINRLQRIRNIGILAHIDAGKTTTTERMLFYAGKTHQLGEVHHGTTVTDYLAQERERGITICSAAVSFDWTDGHRINLLDTPGHIDFTMEVEQSLAAIDGGVVILDGSAGVEVQTVTVWSQADRQQLPRLVFVNKMDRRDADFAASVEDVRRKLGVQPVAVQWPVHGSKGGISGIIDIIRLQQLHFTDEGRTIQRTPLTDDLLRLATVKRDELIDLIATHDDQLADHIISTGSMADIPAAAIDRALRQATLNRHLVPVLLGSAYKNCGIQPLIDAVTAYLPNPSERWRVFDCFGSDFAGKVFKVTHDKQRGPLSLVRMMRGRLRKGAKCVTSQGGAEQVQRLYEPLADEYREVQHAEEGDVVIVAGLKSASTGDLLVASMSSLRAAQKRLRKASDTAKKTAVGADVAEEEASETGEDGEELDAVTVALGLRPRIPDAVYFCSVEPPSQSQQLALDGALRQMQREDPSLRVRYDESTGQTVLGGMGELHLDIVRSRLHTEHKIDADLGPLQIAYKETLCDTNPAAALRQSLTLEKEIAGTRQSVTIELSLDQGASDAFRLDSTPEANQRLSLVWPRHLQTVRKGAAGALERGPKVGGQLVDVQVVLHDLRVGRGTADSVVQAAAAQCVQKLLLAADSRLLEPIMALQIVAPADRTPKILGDLGKRRATVLDVGHRGADSKLIAVLAPLAELAGYSSALRIISSGAASVSMQPHDYAPMSAGEEARAIRRAQGLE